MKRRLLRVGAVVALIGLIGAVVFEMDTCVARGWLFGEPFYDGRPASFWAREISLWQTQDPEWRSRLHYERRPAFPQWIERLLPKTQWPRLFDGDPDGLIVLQALRTHSSREVQDWARIGIERIENSERGPSKRTMDVLVTAKLFEVDDVFWRKVASCKWLSRKDLEAEERAFLELDKKKPTGASLFDALKHQSLLLTVRDIRIPPGSEALVVASTKEKTCLPSPAQRRKGQKDLQRIEEGVHLRAQVHISTDNRYVRINFTEKASKLEGIESVPSLDEKGNSVMAELPCIKQSVSSVVRNVPDGASILLPLQYPSLGGTERRLVVRVDVGINVPEEEERIIKAPAESD